jgi:SET and MYND domain-containing protein
LILNHWFRSKLRRCSGCQYVYYCDRSCQKKSWNIHKFECANLKKILPKTLPDTTRLIARIIVKLQKGGGEEKEYYTKNLYRKFKDLMSRMLPTLFHSKLIFII